MLRFMCRQVELARKDSQPCTQEQYNPSIWWPWRAWRLQVGKAAGMEIPEEETRTGGDMGESMHSWQLSGHKAGQGG